jgi:uncharacterized protein (TIGR00290 family)
MTPVLLAWSGGKDSALALMRLREDPRWRVAGLLVTVDDGTGRVGAQFLRPAIVREQAARLELPLFEARVPAGGSNDAYVAALALALAEARAREPRLATLAFGDLFLADVRAWREAQLARLGWAACFPLWGDDTTQLARSLLGGGWDVRVCCVDTTQLAADFCGRRFDAALLADLPEGCDPCGENGEFHTCVMGGALWQEPLRVETGARHLHDGRFAWVDLIPVA